MLTTSNIFNNNSTSSSICYGTELLTEINVRLFSHNALKSATDDFHPKNKIGGGGFGVVYRVSCSTCSFCLLILCSPSTSWRICCMLKLQITRFLTMHSLLHYTSSSTIQYNCFVCCRECLRTIPKLPSNVFQLDQDKGLVNF